MPGEAFANYQGSGQTGGTRRFIPGSPSLLRVKRTVRRRSGSGHLLIAVLTRPCDQAMARGLLEGRVSQRTLGGNLEELGAGWREEAQFHNGPG